MPTGATRQKATAIVVWVSALIGVRYEEVRLALLNPCSEKVRCFLEV